MSEFSDAYYVHDDGQSLAKDLRGLGRFCLCFPSVASWRAVLIEGPEEAGGPIDGVGDVFTGPWFHCAYAEDHGLWLRGFRGSAAVLEVDFTEGVEQPTRTALLEGLGLVLPEPLSSPREVQPDVLRRQLEEAWGFPLANRMSCADLTQLSRRDLDVKYPDAEFVLVSKKGKYPRRPKPEPNEYCRVEDAPYFMYWEVPAGEVNEEVLRPHLEHWRDTNDFDNDRGVGFWLYSAYKKALPSRYKYLADRLKNAGLLGDYDAELRDTLRAILAVCPRDFDWGPYLRREKGGVRI